MTDRPWIVVSTSNFEIYTDGDIDTAKERLDMLERFRAAVAMFTTVKLVPDLPPMRLIVPQNIRDYETLRPEEERYVGYYRPTLDGPVAVFSLRADGRSSASDHDEGMHIALHEYVHHLQYRAGAAVPLWYNEGLAEYLAASRLESSGRLELGRSLVGRVSVLESLPLVSYRQLVLAPETVDIDLLYPQSWLLVHFLIDHHNSGLGQYLRTYRKIPKEAAFAAAFGFPLDELDLRIRKYMRRGRLRTVRVDPLDVKYRVEVEPMSVEERDYLLASMGVGRLGKVRMRTIFRAAPAISLAHLAYAQHLVFEEKKAAEATELVDKVLQTRPNDARALVLKARILMRPRQLLESPPEVEARVEEGSKLAARAHDRDPGNAEAVRLIAEAGLWLGHVEPRDIQLALKKAMNLAPYRDDILFLVMRFESIHGRPANARRAGELLLSRSTDERMRALTRAFLSELGGN